ncbi:30S ribosomal protein S2 [Patescibacteria group bacterium]|nr:30S ribosomal protein S2 [Patescibacteria group bacterium]MBU1705359.1 30S ribosomal protein S2 [Patescibacteria group bacterium]
MQNIPTLEEMLKAGVHFGQKTSRWHPKMTPFIFGARGGIHIINLETTQDKLKEALEFIKGVAARGGVVLFVGSKKQARKIVKEQAEKCGMPYVTERWLGGTLTNFGQIKKSLKRLRMLKDQDAKGELKKYTKKEQLLLRREIKDMDRKLGGIINMEKIPEAIFVVDIKTEKTAVAEAQVTKTKVVAVCDSNVNPDKISYIIPANDDSVKSIEMMCAAVAEAIEDGKKVPVINAAEPMNKKPQTK